jgi:hypothetical protein
MPFDLSKIQLYPRRDLTRSRQPSGRHAILRPKLLVGQTNDPLEQEADHIADHVMRTPGHPVAVSSVSQQASRQCPECEDGTPALRPKPTGSHAACVDTAPSIVDDVLGAPGQPLDIGAQEFFGGRFGYDLSLVRIHTDPRAAESAHAVGARAYTVGSHVVFGAQQYSPLTNEGRWLLAHELTHVAQQDPSLPANRVRLPQIGMNRSQSSAHKTEASQPVVRRQQIPGTVIDTEPVLSLDQPTSSRSAKSSGTAKQKPGQSLKERIPTATSAADGALRAITHAKNMHDQQDPAIWFDSWGNDLRDNNLNGVIDEKAEQGIPDGAHYGRIFDAKVCTDPSDTVDRCPPADQGTIKVQYKVCIDIPIESYKAAGANVSTSRWIPTFFGELSKKPNWTVWKKPAEPSELLAGDIVAADNAAHQHAGIVDAGFIDNVINLPGPTSSRKYHLFNPGGKNDMVSVPRMLFEAVLKIDWVARLNK